MTNEDEDDKFTQLPDTKIIIPLLKIKPIRQRSVIFYGYQLHGVRSKGEEEKQKKGEFWTFGRSSY